MSWLDYNSFPHILEAVVEHLVADRDEDTLHTLYRLSRSARDVVYRKCSNHLAIDYRVCPVKVGTALCGFWNPDHHAPAATVDIIAGEDYSMYPLSPEIHRVLAQAAPRTIRLLDHYGMADPLSLSYKEPVDTVVFHTRNWCLDREPDPWFLMLPPNAKRVIVNLIGCDEFGLPDVAFTLGHEDNNIQQELIFIVTEGGVPPPGAEAIVENRHYPIDNLCFSLVEYLEDLPESTVTMVGAKDWKAEWSELTPSPDVKPEDVGQHLFTRAFTNRCLEETFDVTTGGMVQHPPSVADAFLQRIKFVGREEFKRSVGDRLFGLMTEEAV